ncbi:hypothetical protein N864_00045 [Intrasporangium chromatireducens Q5-1]|uniref:Integral membrane protein n=1 Tax=Intrasporangium chromatireducens Q5-1 TaxID=584657 RepID=W9GU98_9MICO|nr:hypothetical protein N864_00045 [Intrasporangium chromatireducens Q5-1]
MSGVSPTSSPTSSALPTAARAGLVTALATWSVVVLPALVGWVSAPESSLGWWSGMAVGSAIWFLGHGQSVAGAGIAVSTTPLLLLGVFVVIAWRVSRRLLLGARSRVRRAEWDAVLWRGLVPGYLLGYVIAAAVFAALMLAGSVHPDPMAIVGCLLVPLLGLAIVLVRPGEDTTPDVVARGLAALPDWAGAAWRAAWRGALLLLAAGMVLVLLRVLLSLGAVLRIQSEYGAELVATIVLALAQVAFLGNAATWALAFLAGPGFSVAVDGVVSPAGAHPGLMPLIPVLGALPDDATYPGAMWAVVAVPVLLGGVIAWRVDRLLRPAAWRERLGAMVAASVGSTVLVTVLTALANGAMGLERLRSVGVDIWPFAGLLLAELLGGTALWLLVALYREHTEPRPDDGHESRARTVAADRT